jgi:hypothetical protein
MTAATRTGGCRLWPRLRDVSRVVPQVAPGHATRRLMLDAPAVGRGALGARGGHALDDGEGQVRRSCRVYPGTPSCHRTLSGHARGTITKQHR